MKEKYSKITFKILLFIPMLFILFAVDQFILPQKQISDNITEYSKIEVSRRSRFGKSRTKEFLGFKFYTEKGYEFSLSKTYIEENKIVIFQSYIFRNINKIRSKSKDYSAELMSGLNGACLYIALGLIISTIISLLLLKFSLNLTENGFQNIILLNGFLTLVVLYLLFVYN